MGQSINMDVNDADTYLEFHILDHYVSSTKRTQIEFRKFTFPVYVMSDTSLSQLSLEIYSLVNLAIPGQSAMLWIL